MAGKKVAPSASALERVFRYNRPWLHLLLAGAKVATGQTPKEVVWAKNKATLHRYVPPEETRSPIPGPPAAGLCADLPALHPGSDPGQQPRRA